MRKKIIEKFYFPPMNRFSFEKCVLSIYLFYNYYSDLNINYSVALKKLLELSTHLNR